MSFLYIDTTGKLVLGVLSQEFKWREFRFFDERKNSQKIHSSIYEMLHTLHLDLESDIEALIYSSGPGAYTGMRLSEGIAQVLRFMKIKTYSFYNFEVPRLLGVKEGLFLEEAHKGEFFCLEWEENEEEKGRKREKREKEKKEDGKSFLISKESFFAKYSLEKNEKRKLFSHFELASLKDCEENFDLTLSSDLIEKRAEEFFKIIYERGQTASPYYFRSLDLEFKNKKR